MGLIQRIKKALDLVEGRENLVAKQVSKKTGVDEDTVKNGLEKAQNLTGDDETDEK